MILENPQPEEIFDGEVVSSKPGTSNDPNAVKIDVLNSADVEMKKTSGVIADISGEHPLIDLSEADDDVFDKSPSKS